MSMTASQSFLVFKDLDTLEGVFDHIFCRKSLNLGLFDAFPGLVSGMDLGERIIQNGGGHRISMWFSIGEINLVLLVSWPGFSTVKSSFSLSVVCVL